MKKYICDKCKKILEEETFDAEFHYRDRENEYVWSPRLCIECIEDFEKYCKNIPS